MARGRGNRRRRRGRFSALLKVLSALVVIAALVVALAMFFRMDHIVVTGNERYSDEEVIEASGLQTGENLYTLNKFAVKERIFAALPYVRTLSINRKLPDTLLIEVRETSAAAAIDDGDGVWLVSMEEPSRGRLLERTERAPLGCPLVTGEKLIDPAAAQQMQFRSEAEYRAGVMATLLAEAEERGMTADIGTIEIGDETALQFDYLGRFAVKLPWTSDVGYKLTSLLYAVSRLEANETGVINLMTEGKTSFIPY